MTGFWFEAETITVYLPSKGAYMPRLDEVFKKSGLPTHTFVQPSEYARVVVALQSPGRCMIIEGPSGIGKTTCIKRAIEDAEMSSSCLFLSARKLSDIEFIKEIPNMQRIGLVVVDDFHRLPIETKKKLADFVKSLADEEDESSKVILIGINQAGQTLIEYAPDVLHRIEVVRVGRTNIERIVQMIELGQRALNCNFSIADEISGEAEGSFAMAHVLCHEACLQSGLMETHSYVEPKSIDASLPAIREAVIAELTPRFFPVARDFCTGNRLRREGRAPYLNLLRWLSLSPLGVLDTKEVIAANPKLKGSVSQVIEKGHLETLINSSEGIKDLIHFEPKTSLLTIEDPKFLYFIRNILWSKFAKQVGYFSIDYKSRYDFALSFAGEDRTIVEAISQRLIAREISVFYDKNEQHRILANDVEDYLAPIYRSDSQFVVAFLSQNYPKKIWTKFESEQFKHRFGDHSVIPIWFTNSAPSLFDETHRVGGMTYNSELSLDQEADKIVEALALKIEEERVSKEKEFDESD